MKIEKLVTVLLIICMIFLEGCSGIQVDTSNKILAPKNSEIPIKGTWRIGKYRAISKTTLTSQEINNLINKTAVFDVNYASFGDEICDNAAYKIKDIDAKNYFSHTYNMELSSLDLNLKDVEVISVTSGEKLFYDFIRISENQLLVYIDNTFFYLTKETDSTNILQKTEASTSGEQLSKIQSEISSKSKESGVLLGLRGSVSGEQGGFDYKTLWISANNYNVNPVYQAENLIVPRKTGFWMLGVNRASDNGYTQESIFSYPIEINRNESAPKLKTSPFGNIFRKILFVGNDYVSTDYSFINSGGTKGLANRLQVLPMDKITDSKGIKISDVAGENGRSALMASGKALLSSREDREDYEDTLREDSFGIFRQNGHWAVMGRINHKEASSDAFLDFNVNIMPPSKILNYDNLHVSWREIKEKVPDAVDAYTSPNKDLAIVICKNVIFVYRIEGKKLGEKPLKKITIKDGESVVMAEWATGDYVDRWGKIVAYKGTVVEDK